MESISSKQRNHIWKEAHETINVTHVFKEHMSQQACDSSLALVEHWKETSSFSRCPLLMMSD